MIVADASAVVELVLHTGAGQRVAERFGEPGMTVHAPHLLRVEGTQAIRRAEAIGDASAARATQALVDLVDLSIERHDHEPFLGRIWQLRSNLTAYDAAYVALAEALDAPLLTCDGRLARAPGHDVVIELVS